MGIRGLYTYVTERGSLWRPMRSAEWPILVIDAGSFKYELCRIFFFGSRHGGDLARLREAGTEFLWRLKEQGWEMVFVFDGAQPNWKADTWTQRAERDIDRADRDLRGVGTWEDCLPPLLAGAVLGLCLRDCDIEQVTADFEADSACCSIARSRGGMVVSRDSDLMVMASPGYVDMPQFFEYGCQRDDNLLVLEPATLWQHFRLTCAEDVAFWATLCGNDFVAAEQLMPWHSILKDDARLQAEFRRQCPSSTPPLVNLVADYIRTCRRDGKDLETSVMERIPQELREALLYSVRVFYVEEFDAASTALTIHGEGLTGPLLEWWRRGKLPSIMVMAARGQPIELPILTEETSQPSSWTLSRPLRAAAARLLPGVVKERVRRDGMAKTTEVPLEAEGLEPPMTNWPFELEQAPEADRARYFRQGVDWLQLEHDWGELPREVLLPTAAMRYLVLVNADMDKSLLEIPWPYIGVWLLQFCLPAESRRELVASLNVGRSDKVLCPGGVPFLMTYLGAYWSVTLLNASLGHPYPEADVCSVYDGPFLHAFLRCLEAPSADVPGVGLDEKGRSILRAEELCADKGDIDLFKALAGAWERSISEVDKPLAGKASIRKAKFTMPRPAKQSGSASAKQQQNPPPKRSSETANSFAALRRR